MDDTEHDPGAETGKVFQGIGLQKSRGRGCTVKPQDIVYDFVNVGSAAELFVIRIEIDGWCNAAAWTLDRQTVEGDTVVFGERAKGKLIGITQGLLKFIGYSFQKCFIYHKIPPNEYK